MFKRLMTTVIALALATLPFNVGAGASGDRTVSDGESASRRATTSAATQSSSTSRSAARKLDKMSVLGRATQVRPFTSVLRSTFEGAASNLVSTATGNLAFSITDLSVHGPMPFMFQRVYASDNGEDRGLGIGWSFVFDDRIELNGDTATLINGAASRIAFRRAGQTQHFVLKTPEPIAHKSFDVIDENTLSERSSVYVRTYKKVGGVYRLSEISDHNSNKLTISFDARGNLARIEGNAAGVLSFEWSDGKSARLLSVTDNAGRKISFKQDGQRLRTFVDPSGQPWTYDYEAGQLTRAADPLKRVLLSVRYDKGNHVAELGDGAGASLYGYEFNAGGISRRTLVSDPLGSVTTYLHSPVGKLLTTTTAEGLSVNVEYSAANNPVRISNSRNEEVKFEYDGQDRLTRRYGSDGTDATTVYDDQDRVVSTIKDGVHTDYEFDERGNITGVKSSDPAGSYLASRNGRGELTSITAADQSVLSYEYDAAGNKTASIDPKAGRSEITYNAAGTIATLKSASGLVSTIEYDASGRVSKKSDNRGHTLTIERDASGAPTGLFAANGSGIRATRDRAGRITSVTSSNGKTRRYAYDARGALTDYTDASGKVNKLQYDSRGRLREVKDNTGRKTLIERDEKGQTKRITVTVGESARMEYDANGKLMNVKRSSNRVNFTNASYDPSMPPAAPVAAQWSGFGDPFGDMWFFDGFWGGGDSFGTFCTDGGLFDSFWGGGFSSWGFFDPFGGFGGFGGGWDDWDVGWGGSWYGNDFGGYYDSGWGTGGYDDWGYDGGGWGYDQYDDWYYMARNGGKSSPKPAKSPFRWKGAMSFAPASYSSAVPVAYCAFGESCNECLNRGGQNCNDSYSICRATALGATLAIAGTVALSGTVTFGVGTVIGGILLLGGEAAALYSCNRADDTCRRNIRSGCPACN